MELALCARVNYAGDAWEVGVKKLAPLDNGALETNNIYDRIVNFEGKPSNGRKEMSRKKNLSFKFMPTKNKVVLRGLREDDEIKELGILLGKYGFDPVSLEEYVDCIGPNGSDLHDALSELGAVVPVQLFAAPKSRVGVSYASEVGGSGLVENRDPSIALEKAWKAWNKAGRPIEGVTIQEALGDIIEEVNEAR